MAAAQNRIRVAMVARGSHVAGGERSLLELARGLPERFEPLMVVTESGELESLVHDRGLPLLRTHWVAPDRRRLHEFAARVREVTELYRDHAIDLIHVNSPVESSSFVTAARLTGRPSAVHVRIRYDRAFLHAQGLALADAVVFNSEALRREVGWSRADVVHNGVRLPSVPSAEDRSRARSKWGGGSEFWIGQVGQVIPMKGVDLTLRAFARLSHPDLAPRLLVIGEDQPGAGAYRREMEALAAELGIADRVRFCGYQRDAEEWMSGLDLLVCPSREEPFGRVLIEAMSREVAVVAARVGGIPEVVRDGVDGRLVPAENVEALAAAMGEALGDARRRNEWARAGRLRASEHFDIQVHARRMARIFDRISAGRVGAGSGDA